MDEKDFLSQLKKAVSSYDDKAQLILFGSRARGDHRQDSDWDFLVVTNKAADINLQKKIRNDIYDVELKFLQPISTLIIDKKKWVDMSITTFHKNVIREGKVL